MQRLCSLSLLLLLGCCLSGSRANRVYVHPFYLFAAENVSCETAQSQAAKPLETLPVTPLDGEVLTPDARAAADQDGLNVTQRTAVLAQLLNSLGLRIYQALSAKQRDANTLLSPANTYGSLVTLYLGASINTASKYQQLLGLRDTARVDCVSLVDGHMVLKTLQSINSLVDDGPKDEIVTRVWAFARQDVRLSEDFVRGTQDFSDASFVRSLDFARRPQEAEDQANVFVEKTSEGRMKGLFTNLTSGTNLLFISMFTFKGNWKTAFQPERTSMQEFHVDERTKVMVPLMTHTGQYHYLDDKVRRCTVVKLALSKRSSMLLVLPHEGASLYDIEAQLVGPTDVLSTWNQNLKEGLLELSLPKFSMSSMTDMRDLLANMERGEEVESMLLGSQAEFDRLSSSKPFTVDKAFNKVLFEMSEEGDEPQNVTQEAGVPLKLSVSRPFFFSVTEGDSNAILLLGKILNPTL